MSSREGFGVLEDLCSLRYPGVTDENLALEHHHQLLDCVLLPPEYEPNSVEGRDVRQANIAYQNYYEYITLAVNAYVGLAQNPNSTFYPIGEVYF